MTLEIKYLNKSFDGKQILKDICLEIEEGEIVSIIGPSGGGKTTLLRCLNNLEDIDSGSIQVDNEEICSKDIGLVFQNFNLFPHMSVMENIVESPLNIYKMDKNKVEEEALFLLKKMDLENKIKSYPYQLSGGQKQRVALIRALVLNPKFICLDEPTSALDPKLREEVAKLIKNLRRSNLGVVVVTHDNDFANKISNRIFYLNEGILRKYENS